MSDVSQQLTQSFDNTSPGAASTPCCQKVEGHWADVHPSIENWERDGDVQFKDNGDAMHGLTFTQWFKASGKLKAKVTCKCADDGRTLGTKEVEVPFNNLKFPLSYTLKPKIPFLIPLEILKQLQEIDKFFEKASGGDPQAAAIVKEMIGEKVMQGIQKLADELCKGMNKCSGSTPSTPIS